MLFVVHNRIRAINTLYLSINCHVLCLVYQTLLLFASGSIKIRRLVSVESEN